MKPIKYQDQGPAVEDIQRRLRVLGYAIDGEERTGSVFLDKTLAAVNTFQSAKGIEPTGTVGPRTWSSLVDSTFDLGDRMLYLRMPYFHGADVTTLQHALNSLGFATGGADGIFGATTERAVTEFQQNYDINPDGLVGNVTLKALFDLQHIWGGKEGRAHSSVEGAVPSQYNALRDFYFDFHTEGTDCDPAVQAALRRLVRYANNLEDAARADLAKGAAVVPQTTVLVRIKEAPPGICKDVVPGTGVGSGVEKIVHHDLSGNTAHAIVYCNDFKSFSAGISDLSVALQGLKGDAGLGSGQVPSFELSIAVPLDLVEAGAQTSLPVGLQLMASRMLDALCVAALGEGLV